jgi:hypothetical protein
MKACERTLVSLSFPPPDEKIDTELRAGLFVL